MSRPPAMVNQSCRASLRWCEVDGRRPPTRRIPDHGVRATMSYRLTLRSACSASCEACRCARSGSWRDHLLELLSLSITKRGSGRT